MTKYCREQPPSPTNRHGGTGPATVVASCIILLVFLCGCAGYQIGAQSLYPAHIRTVYVPMIDSSSFRRNLGERLTEAVMKEIELKTPYKVVGNPNADSVLTAHIIGDTKRLVVENRSGDPREVQVNLAVEVSWIDRRGNVLRRAEPIPLPVEVTDVGGSANLIPEVGQSVATAHQQAIGRLAEQIVALMEAPW